MKMTAREEEKKKKIKEQEKKICAGVYFYFFKGTHTHNRRSVCVKDSGIKLSRQRNKQQ
jgi:hypothetical protein